MATNNFYQSGRQTLQSTVAANGGTITLPYPANTTQGLFTGSQAGNPADNLVILNDNDKFAGGLVSLSYGGGGITITNNSPTPWPAGAFIRVQYPLANQAPLVGSKGAAITDTTGGSASNTLAPIAAGGTYTQADMVAVRNAIATLAAAIKAAGVTA